eukprot:15868288-Heterocapsa_arctica.AAC.1
MMETKITMLETVTSENREQILANDCFCKLMSRDTIMNICKLERVMDFTAFIKTHPFPSYEVVQNLLQSEMTLWAEHGEFNHEHVELIYNNIDDVETVHKAAEAFAARGGFNALQSNFHSILNILKHLVETPEEIQDIWYYVREKLYKGFDG